MFSVISTCPFVPVHAQSKQYGSAWGLLNGTSGSSAFLFNAGYLGVIHASPTLGAGSVQIFMDLTVNMDTLGELPLSSLPTANNAQGRP